MAKIVYKMKCTITYTPVSISRPWSFGISIHIESAISRAPTHTPICKGHTNIVQLVFFLWSNSLQCAICNVILFFTQSFITHPSNSMRPLCVDNCLLITDLYAKNAQTPLADDGPEFFYFFLNKWMAALKYNCNYDVW